MPESPIRTHLRLVRAGTAETPGGRLRKAVPESTIVPIRRAEPAEPERAAEAASPSRRGSAIRKHLSFIAGGLPGIGWGLTRTVVPKRAFVLVGLQEAFPAQARLPRKHVLMLLLAAEILCLGAVYASKAPRPGIVVDEPLITGNVVT